MSKMKTACSAETCVNFYQTRPRHNPEDFILRSHSRDVSLEMKLIVAWTSFENMSRLKKQWWLAMWCLNKAFIFEYCEELDPRRVAESTVVGQVGRDANHDHAETRYKRSLHRQDRRKKTWKFKEPLKSTRSATFSIFRGVKIAEKRTLMAIECA